MIVSLTIFVVSGILLGLFIALKEFQVRTGKHILFPGLRARIEKRLLVVVRMGSRVVNLLSKRSLYIATHFIVTKTRDFLARMYQYLDRHAIRLVKKTRHIHFQEKQYKSF